MPRSAPHDATAAGGRVFVGHEHGNTVTVLQDGRTIRTLKVATQPGGITPVDGGRQIAVVSVRERVVDTYDTRTLERTGRAPAGVGPTHLVSDGKDLLYVTDTAGDGLVVMHLRPKLEVTRRVAFPGGAPYGIAIDDVRHRLWVTLTKRNEVAEVRANARPGVIRRFPTARQANTVAVDSATGRVFVARAGPAGASALRPARSRRRGRSPSRPPPSRLPRRREPSDDAWAGVRAHLGHLVALRERHPQPVADIVDRDPVRRATGERDPAGDLELRPEVHDDEPVPGGVGVTSSRSLPSPTRCVGPTPAGARPVRSRVRVS